MQIVHKLLKFKRFSESPAFSDQQFREKTKLINEVSQIANGVTDSMSELQDVQESVLDMKKFLEYHCQTHQQPKNLATKIGGKYLLVSMARRKIEKKIKIIGAVSDYPSILHSQSNPSMHLGWIGCSSLQFHSTQSYDFL